MFKPPSRHKPQRVPETEVLTPPLLLYKDDPFFAALAFSSQTPPQATPFHFDSFIYMKKASQNSSTPPGTLKEKRSSRTLNSIRHMIHPKKPKTDNLNTDLPPINPNVPTIITSADPETPLSACACHPQHLVNLRGHFPTHIPEALFVQESYDKLVPFGFHKSNAIPCVSLCRDELTKPLLNAIDDAWENGPEDTATFAMHSLAGMVFLGKTGLTAATHHAPIVDGVSRYVFYVFPHIGINTDGNVGKVRRHGKQIISFIFLSVLEFNCARCVAPLRYVHHYIPGIVVLANPPAPSFLCLFNSGIEKESTACGALIAFQQELESGYLNLELDTDDIEQSVLKQRMLKKIKFGSAVPSIAELTQVAYQVCLEDLQRLISAVIHGERADYAVFTGVQINSGGRLNFIWPGECYAVIDGKRHELSDWSEHTPVNSAV